MIKRDSKGATFTKDSLSHNGSHNGKGYFLSPYIIGNA